MHIRRWSMLCVALAAGAPAAAATLIADYQFHGSYASSVAGAPNLVPIGSVTFTTATINGHATDVAAFTQDSGLRMDAPAGISTGGYTVVMQVALDATTSYRKLIDYQDLAFDSGLYTLNGYVDFFPVTAATTHPLTPMVFAQVAMTRDATGQITAYVDGVQLFTFADPSSFSVLTANDFNLFVDDTHSGGGEASAGRVARVRLYSGALSAAEIAALTGVCYANCDGSTTTPVLNVLDFSCFLNRFAAADTYANCDNSTTLPVLNVLDFSCFLNRFAAGCQ